jgi:hypothetical protein
MLQSATNSKNLELVDVERDIAQALTISPPQRDHVTSGFAPARVRTPAQPMPPYVEHHANVDQIGKLSAEAMIAQYEGAVKALEEMGATLIDCVKRAESMAAGCKDTFAFVRDTAKQYREEAKLIFDRIEQASVMTAEVKSVCDEMRKKMEHPTRSV